MSFYLFVALTVSLLSLLVLSAPTSTNQLSKRQDRGGASRIPWIQGWAAVGDSYAAGIGSGERIDYWCSRYDHSYPSLIDHSGEMNEGHSFEYKACSGAKSSDVEGQLDSLSGGQDAITISSGGNDVGLVDLLNECIYTWNARLGCPQTIADSKAKIENDLPRSLDALYAKAQGKLNSGGSVFVTAYARFFDDTTDDCDNVSWHWYSWPLGVLNYQYLTQQRRRDMNELVDLVNNKIREAVERAGSQFVLVEYDAYYGILEGRYCLPGVQEPSPNRANLLFYLDGTNEGSGMKKRQTTDPETFPEHTFEGQIASLIEAGKQNISQESETTTDVSFISVSGPDSWVRVFHPLQIGHSIIASKVLYHMAAVGSRANGEEPAPELVVISDDQCSITSAQKPIPQDQEATCGGQLGLNFPTSFQLEDTGAPVREILYRMRDQACQGFCENVAGVPSNLLAAQRQGDNGCEYAVKLSAHKEAYFYATGSGQNCYDATERMINTCMTDDGDGEPIHDSSWINGPNYGEFFQVGVRDLNGEGSHHPALTTLDSDHLGHVHVVCHRIDEFVADRYYVDISNWDDGNWGRSIRDAVKECGLALTDWKYEEASGYTFADETYSDHWAAFNLPFSNGGCAESKIEKAMGLRGGGVNCPFNIPEELDMFA